MSQCTDSNMPTGPRRCLYTILDIQRSANSDEIKIAYKTQAKIWHPDRNINNVEEATIRFKEINEAYEILSDKHERAWYDAHRDAILRGIDKNEINKNVSQNEDYDPDIDLMPYFNPFSFSSFDDTDPNSFYSVYTEIFSQICELEKLSKKKTPIFGDSQLSYDKIKAFFDFWESFTSRRSFQFATKYNLNDATNRKIRKLMHKENRKLIESKRKKWEDTIFKLVAFVKKRDPRFRAYLIELDRQRLEEERQLAQYQKEIDEIMKEETIRQRQIEIEQFKKEAALNDNDDDELFELEAEELFECVVCDKIFKSENAFKSHESSKKHIKALENLKFQLTVEEEILFTNDEDRKMNDQRNLDQMIAKQMAHQQNVEEIESDERNPDSNGNSEEMDKDYLMALSVEQDDIVNCIDLLDVSPTAAQEEQPEDAVQGTKDGDEEEMIEITDEEILILLDETGVDIDGLLNIYPTLTREHVDELMKSKKWSKSNTKANKKKKKKKRKKTSHTAESVVADDGAKAESVHKDRGDDENLNEFVKSLTTFKNKKTEFLQKQKIIENGVEDLAMAKPKKKRRRRKVKEAQNMNQQWNMNSNISPQHQSMSAPIKSQCKACQKMFASRTNLYAHLKDNPKHALKSQHMNI